MKGVQGGSKSVRVKVQVVRGDESRGEEGENEVGPRSENTVADGNQVGMRAINERMMARINRARGCGRVRRSGRVRGGGTRGWHVGCKWQLGPRNRGQRNKASG